MPHAPPKARMFTVTCLILLVPRCQSSHAERRLPALLFITEELRKHWPSHSSRLCFLPALQTPSFSPNPAAQPCLGDLPAAVGTQTRLRLLLLGCSAGHHEQTAGPRGLKQSWARFCLGLDPSCRAPRRWWGWLVVLAIPACLQWPRPPSLDQLVTRGWERGCPLFSLPLALGEMLHPGNPFPLPTVLLPRGVGLWDLFFIAPVLAEDEPPQLLFLSKLVLEGS